MPLESFLTTIPRPSERPRKLVSLGARVGTKVTIPWLDLRRCEGVVLDVREPAVKQLMKVGAGPDDPPIRDRTLEIALKVYYAGRPLFHAPLTAPKYDMVAGTVELTAQHLRLDKAVLREGDGAISSGVANDGEGIFSLLASAQNSAAEDALDYPSLGLVPGLDTTTDSASVSRFQRYDKVLYALKQVSDLYIGPDFEEQPFETDPAELASGPQFANYFGGAADIADNATTDFELDVVLPGLIGGLKLGTWIEHTRPGQVNIDLIHPDGTSVRVYTGSKETTLASAGGDFLGQGTAADACYFEQGHPKIYGEAYPHVGIFRPDRSLLAFLDKPAAGTWKLRVHDTAAGDTGVVNQFWLGFTLPASAYSRLNVMDKPDTDALPAPDMTFHAAGRMANTRIFTVTPRGDLVANQFIAHSQAGGRRIPQNADSRADYGTYQEADSPGDQATSEQLLAWGQLQVGAYSRPLPELELAPKDDDDSGSAPRYGIDFHNGRFVRAIGKRGYAWWDLLAQIRQVTLTQQARSVRTDLDVVAAGVPATSLGED